MSLEIPSAERMELTRFLLGQLADEEHERVEDRFAADLVYFAHYKEVEGQLLRDYATGAMTPEETRQFEQNYLVTAGRRHRLAVARALLEVRSSRPPVRHAQPLRLARLVPALGLAGLLVAAALYWGHAPRPAAPEIASQKAPQTPVLRAPARNESTPTESLAANAAPPPSVRRPAPSTVSPRTPVRIGPEAIPEVAPAPPSASPPDETRPPEIQQVATNQPAPQPENTTSPVEAPPAAPTTAPAVTYPTLARSSPRSASKSAVPRTTPARPATPVDKVIEMVRLKTGEDLILRAIVRDNLKSDLGVNDMLRLKQAGASDRLISAIRDPPSLNAALPSTTPGTSMPARTPAPVSVASIPRVKQHVAAIDEFDWAAVKTPVQEIFQTNVDIGKGIRTLLATRLRDGGKIRIVERAKIQTVMQEQDFGASNRVKRGTNARIGQIRGADVYLMGDIVAFGRDDRDRRFGLGTWLPRTGSMAKIGQKEEKAVVVINYRLVDAETSEVISTGVARGESNRKSKGLVGIGVWPGGIVGGAVDMTSANFAETMIGEATIDACNKLAAIMNDKVPGLPRRQIDVEAYVADVTGSTVTLAAGSSSGISAGDHFEVFHVLSEIKDPITGEVLDQKVEKSGELMIDSVREKVASGQYRGAPVAVKTYLARKVHK